MEQAIYNAPKEAASQRRTVTFGEVAPIAGLSMQRPPDRTKRGRIITDLSLAEHRAGD